MSDPALAPRNAFHGVIAVWIVALVTAVVLGVMLPEQTRVTWLMIAFGGIILLTFAVQLGYALARGFIIRVATSIFGALVLMGLISAVFAVVALVSAV